MFLALKEIRKEKRRFTMIILVTALIAYLIYFLSALAYGLAELNKTALQYWDADGIILDESANRNIYASRFDEATLDELNIPTDNSINLASTSVYLNDEREADHLIDLVLMGVTPQHDGLTAPIKEGRDIERDHEITVSDNLKDDVDIHLGDTLTIAATGRKFEVVGFTEDSNYNTIPVGYVNRDMASQAMMLYTTNDPDIDATATPTAKMPTRVSGVVVRGTVDTAQLEYHGLEYIEMDAFIDSIPGYVAQVLTFGLMILSLAIVSSVVIGIFMYILTMQKKAIFGVLKIQGYRNAVVVKSVIYQTLFLTVLGFVIGFLLTLITIYFLKTSVPLAVSAKIYAIVTAFSLLCSLIGSLFSVRTILKIDPLDAI